MRKRIGLIVVILLIIVALYQLQAWWRNGRFIQHTDNAYLKADILQVSPRVQGYVTELLVVENQPVKAGDLLLKIDDRDYLARVHQAQAQVSLAQAGLATFATRTGVQQAMVAQANAGRSAAIAESDRAKAEARRQQELSAARLGSAQALDTTEAAKRKASADVDKARAAINAERRGLDMIEAERLQAEAQLTLAEAALELAKIDLADTEIRAPTTGRIGNLRVRHGELVRAGSYAMALVPDAGLHIEANFKETQLDQMRAGQTGRARLDARKGLWLPVKLVSLAPAAGAEFSLIPPENATGNFTRVVQRVPVRLEFVDATAVAELLRPGLSVEIEVDTRTGSEIPETAF